MTFARPRPPLSFFAALLVLVVASPGPLAAAGPPPDREAVVFAAPPQVDLAPAPVTAGVWAPPVVQASCPGNTSPFTLTATPTTVNGGQSYTLSWCNTTYTSGSSTYTPTDYYLYQNSAANPTHYDYVANYGPSTFSVSFTTTTADIGKTFGYVMKSFGVMTGGALGPTLQSNTVAIQVVTSGGGGGGGGGGGSFTPCTPTATTLCLHGNRFQVTASYVANGTPGQG